MSFVIREMQEKTTRKYQHIPIKMATIKTRKPKTPLAMPSASEDREQLPPGHTAGRAATW